MSNWLNKATKALRRVAPPVRESFVVVCVCGRELSGQRRSRFQRVLCKHCGEPFFILPTSVYPPPRRQKRPAKLTQQASQNEATVAPVDVPSDTTQADDTPKAETPRTEATQTEATKADETPWISPADRLQRFFGRMAARCTRTLTPFRLVVLSILVAIGITIAWAWHTRAMENAEETLRTAAEAGHAALAERHWATAHGHFETACAAMDRLGRDDASGRAVRQMSRESEAAMNLMSVSLLDMVQEADKMSVAEGDSTWQSQFEDNYRGYWIVIQAGILPSEPSQDDDACLIDYPLAAGDVPGRIIANRDLFTRFCPDGDSREVVFAAQLEGCRLVSSEPRVWDVRLQTDTAFLWADYDNFAGLGFQPDELQSEESIRKILDDQARMIGIQQ